MNINPIYLYNSKDINILPFIICPFQEFQNTFILAPYFLTKNKSDKFLSHLFRNIDAFEPNSIVIRVFKYNSWICITFIFPSNESEIFTNRKGLKFIVGYLVPINKIDKYVSIISTYGDIYLNLLKNTFNTNVFDSGSDTFIKMLQDPNNASLIKEKLIDMYSILCKTGNLTMKKSSRLFLWFKYFLKRITYYVIQDKILPKYVLTSSGINNYDLIMLFLREIDTAYKKKIFINISFPSNKSLDDHTIKIINCLPITLKQIRNVKYYKKNNIDVIRLS